MNYEHKRTLMWTIFAQSFIVDKSIESKIKFENKAMESIDETLELLKACDN